MRPIPILTSSLLIAAAVFGGCGGSRPRPPALAPRAVRVAAARMSHRRHDPGADPVALVTAESENRLLLVDLRRGVVRRGMALPAGPEYVAADPGVAIVSSPGAGRAILLLGHPLRVAGVIGGFGAPHITAITPDGRHVFVSDDARGTVTAIGLGRRRHRGTVYAGPGAHHMTLSPDQRRLWVALGESARTIVIVDTTNMERPRVIGRFHPGFPAHDLCFSPDGARVWVSSAAGPEVAVFGARDHRLRFRVPAGPPPQHIAFAGPDAYLTSGYGSTIEEVAAATGAVIKRAHAPYGSFELDAGHGFVVTSSLLDGKLAIFTPQLALRRVLSLAPATRDVAIVAR